MQNVNFSCGHCGQLLTVSTQHLGMQVRCPGCKQVVTAPATAAGQPAPPPASPPPPAPAPAPMAPNLDVTFSYTPPEKPEENESIFTSPMQTDDLFGASAAKIEMPTETIEPPLPNLELQPAALPAAPEGNGTVPYLSPDATQALAPSQDDRTMPLAPMPIMAHIPEPWMPQSAPSTAPVESDAPADAETAAILAKPRSRGGWHIAILIIPLISYAALATVAVIILWSRLQERLPHPLKVMPDIEGDHPTPSKKVGKFTAPRPKPGQKMPDELVTRLGKSINLGELEVEPLDIVRGSIAISEGNKTNPAEPLPGSALKLKLRFKNLSNDLSFYPMDRFFTRYWIPGGKKTRDGLERWMPVEKEPYTMLEVGGEKFYGGPAGFRPPGTDLDNRLQNEFVVGQEFDDILAPGKELTTFVCTDPEDPNLIASVQKYKGELLWRVQVRRGSVMVEGRRIPCTAVIGVKFTSADIKDEKLE